MSLRFTVALALPADLDIYLGIHRDNARKVLAALKEFGFGALNLSEGSRIYECTRIGFIVISHHGSVLERVSRLSNALLRTVSTLSSK